MYLQWGGVHGALQCGGVGVHVQEVLRVAVLVLWVHNRVPFGRFIGHGRNGRHFGDESDSCQGALLWDGDVQAVVVEGGERPDDTDLPMAAVSPFGTHLLGPAGCGVREARQGRHHDGHRMRVVLEAGDECLQLFVDHRVVLDRLLELAVLELIRQVPVQQEVGDLPSRPPAGTSL